MALPLKRLQIHSFLRQRGKVWVPLWMNGMLP